LAAFLETRLPHHNVQVLTADDFAVHTGPPFDCLVVDEAQDLMAFEFLDRADRLLLGGLDGGRWTIFYDPNRQSRLHGSFDRAAEQLLASQGAARAVLRRNCRNTRQIAFQTRAHTGADIGVATAGSGPEVRFPQVETVGDEAALLEAHLRDLRDQDVTDGSVTLLSASGDWSSTAARALRACRKGRLVRLDAASARRWPLEQLTWSSVVDFKGLENTFVCLIDLEDLADERALDLLYVAMTRARAGLWVATRPSVRTQLTALFTEHAPLALPTLQKGSA
jgi:hypothetical protein